MLSLSRTGVFKCSNHSNSKEPKTVDNITLLQGKFLGKGLKRVKRDMKMDLFFYYTRKTKKPSG